MRTFLMVKAALLPLPLFGLGLLMGWPFAASVVGLVYGIAWAIWRHRGHLPPVFETALILALAAAIAAQMAGAGLAQAAPAIVLSCLALGAFASLATARPWTSEFSASSFAGASASPLFHSVNWWISALWAMLFGWLAVAAYLKLPSLTHWIPVAAGGLVSTLLPRVLVARGLSRMAAGDDRNAWEPPKFDAQPAASSYGDETTDVAIVGAGMGGLTAAALLAQAGLRVQVFDHHVVPGGFAHTWMRRARGRDPVTGKPLVFRFDSGVHDVSGWHEGGTVRSIFERLGVADHCRWVRLDHRYVVDGHAIDVSRDWRAYARQIGAIFPVEADDIAALFEDIHAIYVAMFSTARERGGIPGAPTTAAGLMEYARKYPLAVEWQGKSWFDFVARRVKDPGAAKWISALAGYVTDDEGKARVGDMVPLFGYYFEGGYYPSGAPE